MKKVIAIVLAVALLATVSGVALAASQPAAKATAGISDLQLMTFEEGWNPILSSTIKTPNQKDLVVDVSLVSALYTDTLVKSKRNYEGDPDWDSSTAHAKVDVRVVIDPELGEEGQTIAYPGAVTFNEREQTLSAKFMGIFTGECLIVTEDEETGEHTVTIDYDCLEPEELELILSTLSANSFNFVVADLTPGDHVITVEAKIVADGTAEEGKYEAYALVGQGSVVIEAVRMIKGEDYLDIPE